MRFDMVWLATRWSVCRGMVQSHRSSNRTLRNLYLAGGDAGEWGILEALGIGIFEEDFKVLGSVISHAPGSGLVALMAMVAIHSDGCCVLMRPRQTAGERSL